jgi:VanZ family protein
MDHLSFGKRSCLWSVFIGYCVLLVYLSHQPGDPDYVAPFEHWDKLVHVIEYAVFAILLVLALSTVHEKRVPWIVLSLTLLFAISDEIHQSFVPFREASVGDILADLLGACAGALLLWSVRSRQSRSKGPETSD